MARKTKKRRSGLFARKTTRRRKSNPIGRIMKRRRSSSSRSSGAKTTIMDAVTVGAGLVAGQFLGKMIADKVPALSDGKIRGAALAAVGIFGGKFLPKNMKGVALGIAASGVYQVAKELLPDTIAGDAMGQLSPADVELIENMALESEMTGLDSDVMSTVTGSMDADVMSTVTGAGDDDDDDDDSDY